MGTVGTILNTGSGFITCDEAKEEHGYEPFVHFSVAQQCGLMEGDPISFNVHVSSAGKPQVSAPVWVQCADQRSRKQNGAAPWQNQFWSDWGTPMMMGKGSSKGKGKGKGMDYGGGGGGKASKGSSKGGVPAGCAAMAALGYHKGSSKKGGGERGDRDEDDGRGHSKGSGGGKGYGGGKDRGQSWGTERSSRQTDRMPAEQDLQEFEPLELGALPEGLFVGRVQRIEWQKGFSMINCPEADSEAGVYCHKSVAETNKLNVGDVVAFNIHVNAKGQPQASAPLWKRGGWAAKGKAVEFGEFTGRVSRVLDSCGFVDCPELTEQYGKDAYIHGSVMNQCGIREDSVLSFSVHVSQSGSPQVSAPCWVCVSPDKWLRDDGPRGGGGARHDEFQQPPEESDERGTFESFVAEAEGSNRGRPGGVIRRAPPPASTRNVRPRTDGLLRPSWSKEKEAAREQNVPRAFNRWG